MDGLQSDTGSRWSLLWRDCLGWLSVSAGLGVFESILLALQRPEINPFAAIDLVALSISAVLFNSLMVLPVSLGHFFLYWRFSGGHDHQAQGRNVFLFHLVVFLAVAFSIFIGRRLILTVPATILMSAGLWFGLRYLSTRIVRAFSVGAGILLLALFSYESFRLPLYITDPDYELWKSEVALWEEEDPRCETHLRFSILNGDLGSLDSRNCSNYYLEKFRQVEAEHQSLPNVILVLVDTLRPDHLSTYGYHRETSPFISKLAAEGLKFTNFYANGAWTPPTTSTLLTGVFPAIHGIYEPGGQKRETVKVISETLRDYGYNTAAFIANPLITKSTGLLDGYDYFYRKPRPPVSRPSLRLASFPSPENLLIWVKFLSLSDKVVQAFRGFDGKKNDLLVQIFPFSHELEPKDRTRIREEFRFPARKST